MQTHRKNATAPVDLRSESISRRSKIGKKSAAMAALLASMFSNNAQERLPLKIAPEDRGVKIEKIADGKSIRLSPSGGMHPMFYSYGPVMSRSNFWSTIPGVADPGYVNKGSVTTSISFSQAEKKTYFKACYPDFSYTNFNGFVRLPAGVPREQLTTLAVWLHGDVGANAGYISEFTNKGGAMLDRQTLVSYFPSGPGIAPAYSAGHSWWSGETGPQAQDYAYLLDGIKACKDLVPTIKKVKIIGASQGVRTAVGLVQLYPEQFDGLLIIAGLNSTSVIEAYVEAQNGGKPVSFSRPVPVVGIASTHDEVKAYSNLPPICRWFAAANGFTGSSVTNATRRDYYDSVPGVDSSVIEMGDHVRFILCDAKDHLSTFGFSTNGENVIYGQFIRDGLLPGNE